MRTSTLLSLATLALAATCSGVVALRAPGPLQKRAQGLTTRGGAVGGGAPPAKQWDGAASGLFGNLRTPAALVAGATFGGTFALGLSPTDGLAIGIAKRLYVLVGVCSLAAELLVVIASTVALESISARNTELVERPTVMEWLAANDLELEWLTCQINFVAGLFGFAMMVALRAYISIACPKMALGTIGCAASFLFLMAAFVSKGFQHDNKTPIQALARYVVLVVGKAQSEASLLLLAAPLLGMASAGWLGYVVFEFATSTIKM